MRSRHALVALVYLTCTCAAAIAIIDNDYRDGFMRLADAIVVGFWAYMQQPKD